MNSDIYAMRLNEQIEFNDIAILRVPGGWIYTYYDFSTGGEKTSTFVPFNNEFQTVNKENVK